MSETTGAFRVDGVAAGTYKVVLHCELEGADDPDLVCEQPLVVRDRDLKGVVIQPVWRKTPPKKTKAKKTKAKKQG